MTKRKAPKLPKAEIMFARAAVQEFAKKQAEELCVLSEKRQAPDAIYSNGCRMGLRMAINNIERAAEEWGK